MKRMPAVFIGHGSPYNLIKDNPFTRDLRSLREQLPKPKAIVLISAHWKTTGTFFTKEEHPRQIFDFYGFPQELYDVKYEPLGEPDIAVELAQTLDEFDTSVSTRWGIDHAATIPLVHLFPDADVPVIEMSVDMAKPSEHLYQLGRRLGEFRDYGLLFIGSGNLIHSFRELTPQWDSEPLPWAIEYDTALRMALAENDHGSLVHFERNPLSKRAFQTTEHYLPMLYIIGMRREDDRLRFVHEGFQHGAISHRSFILG